MVRSTVGGAVTRGTDWCGSSQVPGQMGLMEDLRRGDRSWVHRVRGPHHCQWACTEALACLPKEAFWVWGSARGFTTSCLCSKAPTKARWPRTATRSLFLRVAGSGRGPLAPPSYIILRNGSCIRMATWGLLCALCLSVTRVVVHHFLPLSLPLP